MEKRIIAVFILSLMLVFITGVFMFFGYESITGSTIKEQYSYTKAICDRNVCQDYVIMCRNSRLIYKQAITEKVRFSEDWKDPRSEGKIKELCK